MRKIVILFCCALLAIVGTAFLLPQINKIYQLPDEMIVTYSDVENANKNDEYSPFINLSLPKNVDVASDGELTDTVMTVKLFGFIPIKKVGVRLLTDTDVFVGGETVGFNLFSEGVICVGSNDVVTKDGLVSPIKDSGIMEGDAILKIEGIDIDTIQDIDTIINLPNLAGKQLKVTIRRDNMELEIGRAHV